MRKWVYIGQDYRLVQFDHPSYNKRGGVYFKSSLPISILKMYKLQEGINLKITMGSKFCNFIFI